MSSSSLYGIDKNYNGEKIRKYKNSWLFGIQIMNVLADKYIPECLVSKYSNILTISQEEFNKLNEIINICENTEEFWKWAEKNQSFLNFANFEENALGLEPEWVKLKRKLDRLKKISYKTTPWTPYDDNYLRDLLKAHRFTYPELSKKLGRTEGAIQRRICDLGIKERPIKADNHTLWTDEQISLLGSLIKQGYHYEAIHEKIPDKSTKAIRGYVFRFYLTESLDKVRRSIGDGEFGDNLPEKQLRHRHVMNPEDKNEVKENLGMLAYILLQRARQISTVAEEYKEFWQKDMCMNWSDITGCKEGEKSCDSCDHFQRIREQYCSRCGATFLSRREQQFCEPCLVARKKQAQKKWAVLHSRGRI